MFSIFTPTLPISILESVPDHGPTAEDRVLAQIRETAVIETVQHLTDQRAAAIFCSRRGLCGSRPESVKRIARRTKLTRAEVRALDGAALAEFASAITEHRFAALLPAA